MSNEKIIETVVGGAVAIGVLGAGMKLMDRQNKKINTKGLLYDSKGKRKKKTFY
jgi:hypothetical protein